MIVIGSLIDSSEKHIFQIIEEKNEKELAEIALTQEKLGADFILVNAGARIKSEKEDMQWLIKTVQKYVKTPLCIDSPDPAVLKAGVEVYDFSKGQPIVNSITAEKNRWEVILPVVKEYNTQVIGLAMDEKGISDDPEQRLKCADVVVEAVKAFGINLNNLYLDGLVFPVSVNSENPRKFLSSIRLFKEKYPEIKTVGGLYNCPFGLPNEELLTQVFISMCAAYYLDAGLIKITQQTAAALKAVEVMTGDDEYCRDYLAAKRAGLLDIYR